MQVLCRVDENHAHAVFADMQPTLGSCDCEVPVHLPQDLLSKWVAVKAPVVDFRDAELSHTQWAHFVRSISEARPDTITDLHISASATDSQDSQAIEGDSGGLGYPKARGMLDELQEFCTQTTTRELTCGRCKSEPWGRAQRRFHGLSSTISLGIQCKTTSCAGIVHKRGVPVMSFHTLVDRAVVKQLTDVSEIPMDAICYQCGHNSTGFPSLLVVGASCDKCEGFVSWPGAPCCSISCLTMLDLSPSISPAAALTHAAKRGGAELILSPLRSAVTQMTCLTHLGLHHLPLTIQSIRSLGHVLYNLPQCVTVLTLSCKVPAAIQSTASEKVLLFKAVALVRSLEQLCMPQWEAVVGKDGGTCTEPLRSLPNLVSIVVENTRAEVQDRSSVFPAGFSFRTSS